MKSFQQVGSDVIKRQLVEHVMRILCRNAAVGAR